MDKTEQLKIKVGVGVMVLKDGKVLLGRRKGSHGEGEYAFPGGHMEYMESFAETAKREVKEETGLEVENIRFVCLVNLKKYAPKHYVHIGLVADWEDGQPKVMEPNKSDGWDWYDLDKLPTPRFETVDTTFEAYKTGKNYWDD